MVAIAVFTQVRLHDRCYHLHDCLLYDSVYHAWYPQFPYPTRWLWYFYTKDRLWFMLSISDTLFDTRPILHKICMYFIYRDSIHSACTFIGFHLLVGLVHVFAAKYLFHQLAHTRLLFLFAFVHISSNSYESFTPLRLCYSDSHQAYALTFLSQFDLELFDPS